MTSAAKPNTHLPADQYMTDEAIGKIIRESLHERFSSKHGDGTVEIYEVSGGIGVEYVVDGRPRYLEEFDSIEAMLEDFFGESDDEDEDEDEEEEEDD